MLKLIKKQQLPEYNMGIGGNELQFSCHFSKYTIQQTHNNNKKKLKFR